jgi:hypothetical protein
MAMHKPKKIKRFQDGGDVEEAEMKQRGLDISNRAREEGTEKTSFFQRLREGNIDDPNSAAYKKYGAGRARLDDQIATAKEKLAGEVQEKVAANKASDGDVSEYDRRMDAIASMPDRMPTRPGQASSGRMTSAAPKVDATASQKAKTAAEYSDVTDAMRNRSRMAANSANKKSSTTDALRAKSRKEAAFEGAKRMAKTPEGQAQRKAQEKGQALERVTPELALAGASGFGLKTLHAAAKRLAGTGKKTATKTATTGAKSPLRQKTEQLIKEDKNPGRSVSQATASPKVSLKEKTKELIQSDRTAKTKELSSKMAEKQTPTKFASKKSTSAGKPLASKRTKKFNEDESGMDFKRGGSVSSRADGCAQRGKTRCKVY